MTLLKGLSADHSAAARLREAKDNLSVSSNIQKRISWIV